MSRINGDKLFGVVCMLAAIGVLAACDLPWNNPNQPTTTVVQTVTIGGPQSPGASPSPECGGVTGIVLGTGGDDFTLTADGVDDVVLVPSYFQGIAELPPTCTASIATAYTATAPCQIVAGSPARVTASSPGTCTVRAAVGSVLSNPLGLTAVP